jgi:WD40 repeat protein
MRIKPWFSACLLCASLALSGCVPIPVSTVPLHPREQRPIAVETAPAENAGTYSSPAFDRSGALLAAYDSGGDRVRIFRSADLTLVDSLKPARRPRRLSFSPSGQFLVIEAHQGWVERYLKQGALPQGVDIASPEAIRDDIQRVEVWNPRTGRTIPDLSCDAVSTTEPEGGWLWAKNKAITPGYRSSAILEAHFSADEKTLSMLCWNGVRQRWDSGTWKRIEDLPPPPFWDAMMGFTTAQWLAGDDASTRSVDGRIAILRVRQKNFGFPTTYIWDRDTSLARQLPGDCATRLQPIYALSRDGNRIVTVCNKGLGHAIHAWDLGAGQELPLQGAEFGFARGAPTIRGEAVALSPDGRYLAVALLDLAETLLVGPMPTMAGSISRSDLRLWRLDGGREQVAVPIDELVGHADYFRGVDLAFSPDSARLALGGRRLRIYRLSDLGGTVHKEPR